MFSNIKKISLFLLILTCAIVGIVFWFKNSQQQALTLATEGNEKAVYLATIMDRLQKEMMILKSSVLNLSNKFNHLLFNIESNSVQHEPPTLATIPEEEPAVEEIPIVEEPEEVKMEEIDTSKSSLISTDLRLVPDVFIDEEEIKEIMSDAE